MTKKLAKPSEASLADLLNIDREVFEYLKTFWMYQILFPYLSRQKNCDWIFEVITLNQGRGKNAYLGNFWIEKFHIVRKWLISSLGKQQRNLAAVKLDISLKWCLSGYWHYDERVFSVEENQKEWEYWYL